MRIYFIILLCLYINSGCSKSSNGSGGSSTSDNKAVINFSTPVAGFTYLNGGDMRIEGDITDYDRLASARVQIRNKTTNAILFEQSSDAGSVTIYFFRWTWTITGITSSVTATVRVTGRDLMGNEVFKELDVTVAP